MRPGFAALALLAVASLGAPAATAQPAPLTLEARIPLGQVRGRIDHLAIDVEHQRLFVAELGNDSVGVVDLKTGTVRTLAGFREPQGVGYVSASGTLYVANAGDGSLRLFEGEALSAGGRIELGEDADNIRVDEAAHRLYVGHGSGGLAVIDTVARRKVADIAVKGHPESFQLDPRRGRAFVNVPDAAHIAVVDLAAARQVASWQVPDARANFPMAVDREAGEVLVAFRNPAKLKVFGADDGVVRTSLELCDDADDLFVDARRHRAYASCGQGVIDIIERRTAGYMRLIRAPTASGARTSLFVPELDRLFVAVRAGLREPAAVWVFRPPP